MNIIHVIHKQPSLIIARWIDSGWYEEHELSSKSFSDEHPLTEHNYLLDHFYSVDRRPYEAFKLSNPKELTIDGPTVTHYLNLLSNLHNALLLDNFESKPYSQSNLDPIGYIHTRARFLKMIKSSTNPFFKDIRQITSWLIDKHTRNYAIYS